MNTNYKPNTSAVLAIGEHAFEIPAAKLEVAYKLMEFLSGLSSFKEEYVGSYIEEPSLNYCLVGVASPTLGIEIKPRVKFTADEYTKLRDDYCAREKARREAEEAKKLTPAVAK